MIDLTLPKLSQLPSNVRVWVFQSHKALNPSEIQDINRVLNDFLMKWAAHGAELTGSFDIKYNRFIILAVDETQTNASGCSIDSLMRLVEAIDEKYGLKLFDRLRITYRSESELLHCDVNEFRKRWELGEVSEDTIVFNNVLETLADLDSKWEVPVRESWVLNLAPK